MAEEPLELEPPSEPMPNVLIGIVAVAAGAVDAFAAGTVHDHLAGAAVFASLAALQLLWGLVAQRSGARGIALAGAVVHLVALTVWLGVTTSGLSFVDGLESRHSFDATAVAALVLSAFAGFGSLAQLVDGRPAEARTPPSPRTTGIAAAVAALVVVIAAVGSSSGPSTPTPSAPTTPVATTVPGLIGLPTGGGDIDAELGSLFEESDSSTTTTTP